MTTFHSPDVLRFLGNKLTAEGHIPSRVTAPVTSDVKRRQEGVRIKHRYHQNSVKLYDKAYTPVGRVPRAELTMQDTEDFKVYRRPEGKADSPLAWLRLRKGIADLQRRAEVSQKANERYLDALASVDDSTSLGELLCRVEKPVTCNNKRVRALHPFENPDRRLLEIIRGGEFVINGLRNKDLPPLFYPSTAKSVEERRRRSSALSRKLRIRRAHHLIRKVPGSHRYHLTTTARQVAAAMLAASNATLNLLIPKAA